MQTVFNNSMVAHVWAQQTQAHGRNAGNTFYFEGPTIYSYGEHFPIATFVTTPKGAQVLTSRASRASPRADVVKPIQVGPYSVGESAHGLSPGWRVVVSRAQGPTMKAQGARWGSPG